MRRPSPSREQSRARYPDAQGYVERDGVRVFYERYGDGARALFLLPTWSLAHSRVWKAQIPYLARHFRVLTCDPRGNGRSDRPSEPEAYAEQQFADDAVAVMDATDTEHAVLVTLSRGAVRGLLLAAGHPERVHGAVFIAPGVPLPPLPARKTGAFEERLERYEGWQKFNRHYWLAHYEDFLEFFASQIFTEPYSSKQREDAVGWGLETTPEAMIASQIAPSIDEHRLRDLVGRIRCPVLVIHGTEDAVRAPAAGAALARLAGGAFVPLAGSGHVPSARAPVRVNLLLHEFADPEGGRPQARRPARSRHRSALYLSSPIGLGHVRRDVAIAAELRRLHPDLEIEWLAQHPVSAVLERNGERVHPASAALANECRHLEAEAEARDHDLHAFEAHRRMDEILVANFMLFHEVVREASYDLWIGDEAWELDYFLHENPELKRAAYVWLTDFVGWLPMPDGGEREASLTSDYNAEMIEQVARHPGLRDRALFVGDPDDIVTDTFGPDLPVIRDWTEQHYTFTGYVTGFDPAELADREQLRGELGYRVDEQICIVTVGGSGVGSALLRRVIEAYPEARRLVPELRMVVVAGPRVDPAMLPAHEEISIRTYLPDLHRHLAACDIAVIQGGLSTAMELTAGRRPFLYFPLRHHFEQRFHVANRLTRYGAGRRMDFETDGPGAIARAIAEEIGRDGDYLAVDAGGAARAAAAIAELL